MRPSTEGNSSSTATVIPGNLRRVPFRTLTYENWVNLLLAAVLSFYLFYLAWEVMLGTTCGQLGVDFCDYWSAGRVASSQGYAGMYDLKVLYEVEKSTFPANLDPAYFPVVPFLYLPVFVLPFQLLSLTSPPIAFWIWNGLNILILWIYLRVFLKSMGAGALRPRWMLMVLVSLPVFLSLFAGQVGVFLVICVGEYLRARRDDKPFKAGLWLAGLLLKPQVLVLLMLILLLHRCFKILGGLAMGGLGLIVASAALIGTSGLAQMLRLWLAYADDQARIWVEGMMNWRMLGFHLASLTGPAVAYGLALSGMVLTMVLVLRAWGRRIGESSTDSSAATLGILAATTMFTWHSQINTAMALVPPLLHLLANGTLPRKTFYAWVFLPTTIFIAVVFAPGLLNALGMTSKNGSAWLFLPFAAAEFAVNGTLFWWAMKLRRQAS